jgi:hypothetical protein
MLRRILNVSVLIMFGGICHAADGGHRDLALGLDKVRWGMTVAEVRAVYPSLNGERRALSMTNYFYEGCNFDVYAEFTDDRFDSVILETADRSEPCYQRIKNELRARFGTPDPAESRNDGTRLIWKSSSTLVAFIGDNKFLHIAFEQASGSPHHVIYDPAPPH